jgi:hypothetical protein
LKCKICEREEQENGFCPLHAKAYQNIVEKFRTWEASLNITWRDYLGEVQKNSLTGVWAKDVAEHLIEEENQK